MSWNELNKQVVKWAKDRDIFYGSTPQAQLLKAMSEMGELADAEIKGDAVGRMDAVGDVLVCLIIYCKFYEMDAEFCLSQAYEEIKNRKGKMVAGGAFVKDE